MRIGAYAFVSDGLAKNNRFERVWWMGTFGMDEAICMSGFFVKSRLDIVVADFDGGIKEVNL